MRVGNSGYYIPAVSRGSTSSSVPSGKKCVAFGPTNRTALNSPAPDRRDGNTNRSPSNIPFQSPAAWSGVGGGWLALLTSKCHSTPKRSRLFLGLLASLNSKKCMFGCIEPPALADDILNRGLRADQNAESFSDVLLDDFGAGDADEGAVGVMGKGFLVEHADFGVEFGSS